MSNKRKRGAATIKRETPHVFDITDTAGAANHLLLHGFVVVNARLSKELTDAFILENFAASVLEPGIKPEHRIVVPCPETQRPLDFSAQSDRAALVRALTQPLDCRTREAFARDWCMHRGFGACCNPAVFHLASAWKIREALYPLARALTLTDELWVCVNRPIQKLPCEGEAEFLHWDLDPFAPTTQSHEIQSQRQICGKFACTPSRFVCVAGTHTPEFMRTFGDLYAPLYTNARPNAAKFALDPETHDPLALFEKQRVYTVPQGCVVFWHPSLLHGQTKTPPTDPIEFGLYVGYFPAGSRQEYQDACGTTELDDRIGSYTEGRAPKLWPSFDPVHYYPKRWQNFPKPLEAQIARRVEGHASVTTRVTKSGKTVPHLVPVPDPLHVPPPLSLVGKRLLGLVPY